MDDLISRHTILKWIDDCLNNSDKLWEYEEKALIGVKQYIKHLPSIKSESKWIPCSERLPEEGERVLCTHTGRLNPNRQVIEHIYQNGKFTMGWDMDMNPSSPTFGQRYMGDVIAWMPLPPSYKGEDG